LEDEQKAGGQTEGWKSNRRLEDGEKAGEIEGRSTERRPETETHTAFVFFESPFTSVSIGSRGHPSPVSLAGELRES
jgi:hypothetical protein